MDLSAFGSGSALQIERNDRHLVDGGIVDLGERVLHQELVQAKAGARHREVAFGGSHGGLIRHDLHRGDGLELKLLLIVGESLVGEAERALIDLLALVGIDEVPVDVLDLGHGGDDLGLESKVGDLGVALGDADEALVGGDPEAGQKGLGRYALEIGIELGIDAVVRSVAGDTLAEIVDVEVGADGERLGEIRQDLNRVGLQNRHAGQELVGLLDDGVIDVALEGEEGIEGRNGGAGAEGRGDDAAICRRRIPIRTSRLRRRWKRQNRPAWTGRWRC